MPKLEITFRLHAHNEIPADHAYLLYSAISHQLPEAHRNDNCFALHPISGCCVGARQMKLMADSHLILRVEDGNVAPFLQLSGKSMRLGKGVLQVGIPEVRPLTPASHVRSRLVVIKVAGVSAAELTEDVFLAAAQKQIGKLGISEDATIEVGKRRTLRIRQKEIVGYETIVSGLSAEDSLQLQSEGIGGRRKLGCGVFVPARARTAAQQPSLATTAEETE